MGTISTASRSATDNVKSMSRTKRKVVVTPSQIPDPGQVSGKRISPRISDWERDGIYRVGRILLTSRENYYGIGQSMTLDVLEAASGIKRSTISVLERGNLTTLDYTVIYSLHAVLSTGQYPPQENGVELSVTDLVEMATVKRRLPPPPPKKESLSR